jgi:hypothetical protein
MRKGDCLLMLGALGFSVLSLLNGAAGTPSTPQG